MIHAYSDSFGLKLQRDHHYYNDTHIFSSNNYDDDYNYYD